MTDFSDARGVTATDGTTKARIERAAICLFSESNIDAVTTREIAAKSGVSEGAIYRHYSSKAALAETLFFAIHNKLAEDVRTAGEAYGDVDSQMRAIIGAYCKAADEDWTLFSYHLLNAHHFLSGNDGGAKTDAADPVAQIEKIVQGAMERGETPEGKAALKAAMALGVVQQTALHKLYGRFTGDLSKHERAIAQAALAALHA